MSYNRWWMTGSSKATRSVPQTVRGSRTGADIQEGITFPRSLLELPIAERRKRVSIREVSRSCISDNLQVRARLSKAKGATTSIKNQLEDMKASITSEQALRKESVWVCHPLLEVDS